jgi:hypothetical protein
MGNSPFLFVGHSPMLFSITRYSTTASTTDTTLLTAMLTAQFMALT